MRVQVTATVKSIDRTWYGGNRGRWFYYIDLTNIVADGRAIPDQRFGQGVWMNQFAEGEPVQFYATLDGDLISFPSNNTPKTKEELKVARLVSQEESRQAKKRLLELMTADDLQIIKSFFGRSYGELASLDVDTLMADLEEAKQTFEERRQQEAKRAEDARRLDEKKTAILERCESNLELLVGTYRPSQILTNGFDKEAQWPSNRDEQLDIIIQAVRWQLQNIVYRLEKLGV